MYQTFSPLLDALKERGADPEAVDRAAEEAEPPAARSATS